MTPREFILHWHREAGVAAPRFFPNSWEQHAQQIMERGIGAGELSLVAKWMRAELGRSQAGERNAVAFNRASFTWRTMFGEFGASNQDANFLMRLSMAEAALVKPKAVGAMPKPGTKPAAAAPDAADLARIREQNAQAVREFEEKMRGGGQR